MNEKKVKVCPFLPFSISNNNELLGTPCLQEKCGWYDDENHQCSLITIAKCER